MKKKIKIVERGLRWQRRSPSAIRLHEIAHPIDKFLLDSLETLHVNELLDMPIEQMVSAKYGLMLSTGIVLDQENFPDLYHILRDSAQRLGIKRPYTIITNELPGINAFATGTDDKPFIVISNLAPRLLTQEELRFIVAHECGHIAMEHMAYHTAGALAATAGGYIPLLGPVIANAAVFPLNCWNRCSEISADRIGLLCCGNLHTAQKALLKIISGATDIQDVNVERYIAQSRNLQNVQPLGKIGEFFQTHPMIYKRLKALEYFSESELYYQAAEQAPPPNKELFSTEKLNEKVNDLLRIL